MKFYSEITNTLYDSEKELVKAEQEAAKAKNNRAEKAKEVTELLRSANEANKKASKALSDFIKEYGSFKTTIKDADINLDSFWDIFNVW